MKRMIGLIAIALCSVTLAGCERKLEIGQARGNLCPEIEGVDATGKSIKLSDYRGKVVLIDFWATWCEPCKQIMPHTKSLVRERYKGKPFAILGIALDTKENVKKFAYDMDLPWENIVDEQRKISKYWDVNSIPAMILVDDKGVIQGKWISGLNPEEVERAIVAAMQNFE